MTMAVSDDRWVRHRRAVLVAYCLVFVWSAKQFGIPVDRLAVLAWIFAAFMCGAVGRPRDDVKQSFRDWAVVFGIYMFYDYSRGIADQLGIPVNFAGPRNVDRFLFFGVDPTAWMQERFYVRGDIKWYDVLGSIIYMTHFVFPVALAVFLRWRGRERWVLYVRRLGLMLVGGVVGYIAYPAAPPWMAAKNGYIDKIDRITGRGWSELNLDTVSKTFDRGVAVLNPVAAMPSLHAATALLVVLWFFPNRSWWMRAALLLHHRHDSRPRVLRRALCDRRTCRIRTRVPGVAWGRLVGATFVVYEVN